MTIAQSGARSVMLCIWLLLALGACGSKTEPPKEPPPVQETVFGDLVGTMDKARSVEATTLQHKEELDRSLEEAEGN